MLTAGPRVVAVEVASTSWSPAFVQYLQNGNLDRKGYDIPLGSSAQTDALTWSNLNQIRIKFDTNVVLNSAFGEPVIAVDTHIFRLGNRLGLAPGKTPLEVEQGLEKVVPAEFKRHAHHWLILHGRYVCKARGPDCPRCIIADLCHSPEKRLP